MKVISLNVNGIRSAHKKGAFAWFLEQQADVLCLQEVRADESVLKTEALQLPGYFGYHLSAEKKGYSGVSIFTKKKPKTIVRSLGFDLADSEGRYLHLEFEDIIVASIYFPSGTSGEGRQALKYQFLDAYLKILDKDLKSGRSHILCGDWNIAHKNEDVKNWKANRKSSGFLPEERAWLDTVFDKKGWVDAFRVINQQAEEFTWWSSRSKVARANNIGWRIDYQVVTPDLKDKIKTASIYKEAVFSDHAPVIVEYDLKI